MKVRKLKKQRQEMAGWPETIKCPSSYGYNPYGFYDCYTEPSKHVRCAMYVTTWRAHQWRKYE
jgi:hypothetical protein